MTIKHILYEATRVLKENNIIDNIEHNRLEEKIKAIKIKPVKTIEITEKDFKEFERIRCLDHINMYCVGNEINDYSNKISKEKFQIILKDFETYLHKFGVCYNER